MIRVTVLYPNNKGSKFDLKYYVEKHMALVKARLDQHGLVRIEVDKGIGGADRTPAPFVCIGHLYFNSVQEFQKGLEAHGPELISDVPNYTDIEPQIQISEIVSA